MDKTVTIAVVFLFFVVADASLSWKSRKLADEAPRDNSTATQASQSSPSVSTGKTSGSEATDADKSNGKSNDVKVLNNSSNSHFSQSSNPESAPPPQNRTDNQQSDAQRSNSTKPVSPPPPNQRDDGENEKELSKTDPVSPPPENKTGNGKNGKESSEKDSVKPLSPNNKDSSDKDSIVAPPVNRTDNGSGKKNDDKPPDSGFESGETCGGVPNRCRDEKTLVACIQNPRSGAKERFILVQNEGNEPLKVNIAATSIEDPLEELEIPAYRTKRVNISLIDSKSNKVILDAGHGDCVLHMDVLVSEGNFILHLPSYEKLVTPINGAYFLILTVLIFGGTWACCKFRKRRQQGGVPYQELEMGLPDSFSANNVETAEGWDQGWDDDWDEDNAVKSPGGQQVRNISANGLTSRSANRDGWENDWDE